MYDNSLSIYVYEIENEFPDAELKSLDDIRNTICTKITTRTNTTVEVHIIDTCSDSSMEIKFPKKYGTLNFETLWKMIT